MDFQAPDFAATLPFSATDTPETRAQKVASAQRQFEAFQPADEAQAALAAFAVMALQGAVDSMERAAKPGMGAETAARLRGNALAAVRFFSTTLKGMQKRLSRDAEPPPREHELIPIPRIEVFQPRDRRGKPIPRWRNDLMSRKQILAAYDFANRAAWAEATAEEDAAIAEQAELDAKSPPTEEQLAEIFPLTPPKGPPPGGLRNTK